MLFYLQSRHIVFVFLFLLITLFCLPILSIIAKDNFNIPSFASKVCGNFFSSIDVALSGCTHPIKQRDYSTDKVYARKSASLIETTLGVKVNFTNFHHIPFDIQCADRLVTGNFFAFEFEQINQLKSLFEQIPNKRGGSYGALRTKSPQQYELRMIGSALVMLVIDGFRRDAVVEALFEKFRKFEKFTKLEFENDAKGEM